jgi:hypothetical protein
MGSKRDIVCRVLSWVPKDIRVLQGVYHGFQKDIVGYVTWVPKRCCRVRIMDSKRVIVEYVTWVPKRCCRVRIMGSKEIL